MRATFHPYFYADLATAAKHYRQTAGLGIARDFYLEWRRRINGASANPTSFAVRVRNFRRVSLQRFPYHFLFRVTSRTIRILVLRHHRQHPLFGITRR